MEYVRFHDTGLIIYEPCSSYASPDLNSLKINHRLALQEVTTHTGLALKTHGLK